MTDATPSTEPAVCSRGWHDRCPRALGHDCRCACGGRNHGTRRPLAAEFPKRHGLTARAITRADVRRNQLPLFPSPP